MAAAGRSGCRSSVTSWMVPPVCRLAVRRTRRRSPSGSTSSRSGPPPRTVASVRSSTGIDDSPPVAAARRRLWAVDQLGDGVPAVADHRGRTAHGRGHHPVVDHDEAQVLARRTLLDQHVGAVLPGPGARPRASSSGSVMPTVMPWPCSPRAGFTTTSPTSSRNVGVGLVEGGQAPLGHRDARPRRGSAGSRACRRSGSWPPPVVNSESDSRVTTLRPPWVRRSSPASASSTSTWIPRRRASSAMIRA